MVKLINDFPNAGLYGLGFGHIWQENKELINHDLPDLFRGIIENPWQRGCLYWTGSTTTTKTVINKVGLFDERISYGEDLDMWYRILLNYQGVFYNKTLAYYRQDSENRAMLRAKPLRFFLPYYCSKYIVYKSNITFYKFINRWSAIHIRNYYFNEKEQYKDALDASKKLDYSVLPTKYKFFFKTPYLVGLLFHSIDKIHKYIKKGK